MNDDAVRERIDFDSEGVRCAALHYPGTNGGCVVMAGALAVAKEPGTDRFAAAFNAAGFSVLAFDFRHLGESGGEPRQVVRTDRQLADWDAAVATARELPEVDPRRVAIWGFSLAGGEVLDVAVRNPAVAAAIAQSPGVDGVASSRSAMRHTTKGASLRLAVRIVRDLGRAATGREPLMVPLSGEPGTVAVLSTPDAIGGGEVLAPGGRYPSWRQELAARSIPRLTRYRPARRAAAVRCPLLMVVCDEDQSALPEPAIKAADEAPMGRLVRVPGGHYAPFLEEHDAVVESEVAFLRDHLVGGMAESSSFVAPLAS
jgi:pimeloyl-ACP methyl ester carboxylesterase